MMKKTQSEGFIFKLDALLKQGSSLLKQDSPGKA